MYNELCTPTHPGEIIKDNLSVLGLTQKRLAEIINVRAAMLNGILNGKRPLSADVALRQRRAWTQKHWLICRVGIIYYAPATTRK